MSVVWIIVLVVLWAWVLLPGAVRDWSDTSPVSSVERFERCMGMLARSRPSRAGRHVLVLDRPSAVTAGDAIARAARRRKLIVTRLVATVVSTGAVGMLFGGWFWAPFAVSVAALAGYLGLLLHVRSRAAQRRRTVRSLEEERHLRRPDPEPPSEPTEQVVAEFEDAGNAVRIVRWNG